MKYCPNCAYKLAGTEKFCPNCGYKLAAGEERAINIDNTLGDVLGTGLTGSGNIVGKEVGYVVQGNVLNLQIGGNVSREVLDTLQKMMAVPTQVKQPSILSEDKASVKDDIKTKIEESTATQQQIKDVLGEVYKIEEKAEREIKEIKAGDMQISKNELLLKEIILKGNEYYYKKEYEEAIRWYNEILKIEPNNAGILFNKAKRVQRDNSSCKSNLGFAY